MQTENHAFDEAVRQCRRLQAAHAAMTKDTTEEEGVYYALVDALAAAVSCPVSTASDLLAKLDIYDRFRAASSVYVDNAEELAKQQIAALVAEVRNVLTAQQSTPTLPPFQPNNSPGAKMPDGGTYREEPAEWRGRLWSWGDASDICINWLIEVSQTLGLVESRAGDDEHHGPIALAHDRLLETIGELRTLKAEIRLFHSSDDAPVVGRMGHDQDKVSIPPEVLADVVSRKKQEGRASEDPAAEGGSIDPPDDGDLATFADAAKNYRMADAAAHQDDSDEDQAAWDAWGEAFDAAMHFPVTTADELRAKVDLFSDYHLKDRFAENMPEGICDQIRAVFADALRLAEQPAPVNYGILQDRMAKLEAVAAKPGLDSAYRLVCALGDHLDDIRTVRHALVALSMADGMEDWQRGAVDLAFRTLERELEAIADLTDPIAIDWREANGLRPEGGLPDSASDQEDA